MSLNYQGYEVNRKGLHYQNAMLIRIALFGGLHMELAALKTAENLLNVAGGQENWFMQVLHHVGNQTRF